ncbi:hypothetical protein GCM10007108_10420 [Thermogymnomonas acidicola]|uniref:Uncharacterized protein n=1 Tax=Thermogymnomonas acidicola TaxID=399579 RepID=A0AA37BS01_9ARCH|nr:hypothetical protein [Thermogymnomonas acidicola]GGM74406.1 hypothetical protein GCM10007108_10420 [Thermogymnomonas acidicola]
MDLLNRYRRVEGFNVTLHTRYRFNFDGGRTCGFIRVIGGEPGGDEEDYELYMEVLECGLTPEKVDEAEERVVREIREGRIDVSL